MSPESGEKEKLRRSGNELHLLGQLRRISYL